MKKIFAILSVLAVLAGFTSCNKDDSAKGNKEVAALKAMLLDSEGNIVFEETTVTGLYCIGVESKDDAAELAGIYANCKVANDTVTRTIPGGKGTVKVSKGENGVFYCVDFAVESIPHFTLDIEDINKENAGKSGTQHKCGVCGKQWTGKSNTCPWTDKHDEKQ